jgi:hypothetical protein
MRETSVALSRRFAIHPLLLFGRVCYTQTRLAVLPRDSSRTMLRKLISLSILLLLASVQALAANCELRCALVMASPENPGCSHHVRSELSHCHGMPMESDQPQHSMYGSGHCQASVCEFQLQAIAKKSAMEESLSTAVATAVFAQWSGAFIPDSANLTLIRRSSGRPETQRPLEVRPGTSLRI